MRSETIVLLCCACLVLSACGMAQTPMQAADTPTVDAILACEDNARITAGDFVLNNNVWNKGDRTDYTQCVFAQSTTLPAVMGWRWDWPGTGREIRAYPEVMLGDSPWDDAPATGDLPVPVSDEDFLVSYDASIEATGSWNIALEFWLTGALPPAEQNITDEIMIWVDAGALSPGPPSSDIVTIDDVKYSVHINPGHGDASGGSTASWTYITFYSREPQHTATLNLGKFLGYLLENDLIDHDRYVASLELGTEVASGTGEFVLNSYEVTVP